MKTCFVPNIASEEMEEKVIKACKTFRNRLLNRKIEHRLSTSNRCFLKFTYGPGANPFYTKDTFVNHLWSSSCRKNHLQGFNYSQLCKWPADVTNQRLLNKLHFTPLTLKSCHWCPRCQLSLPERFLFSALIPLGRKYSIQKLNFYYPVFVKCNLVERCWLGPHFFFHLWDKFLKTSVFVWTRVKHLRQACRKFLVKFATIFRSESEAREKTFLWKSFVLFH